MTLPWKWGVGMLLSSLEVVLSRLDIRLWLEGVDRPDLLGPLVPLVDKDCSAFSNARRISLTLTARLLFLEINICRDGSITD